jgi:endonuclease/exonuclease/phosphatase family metal-dependent hydrolase
MKLLSWNVQWFRGLDGAVDPERVIRHAQALCDFDVLCLQEVAVHFTGLAGGKTVDQAAAVARLLPGFEVIFTPAVDYGPGISGEREQFGNLIATRLPVLQVEHHLLPFAAAQGSISVRRACTAILVRAARGPLTVLNTHLEYHSAGQRTLQIERIRELHAENTALAATRIDRPEGGLYRSRPRTSSAVLCGDFNCDAESDEFRSLLRGGGPSAFYDVHTLVHGDGPRPPTFGCYDKTYVKEPLACDHVLCTGDIAGLARHIEIDGQVRWSDHQPVHAEWEGL